jgi:hypothetical protein
MKKYLYYLMFLPIILFEITILNLELSSYYSVILWNVLLYIIQYPFSVFGFTMLTGLLYQILFQIKIKKKFFNNIALILFLISSFIPISISINYISNVKIFTEYLTFPLISYTVFFPIVYLLNLLIPSTKQNNPFNLPIAFLIIYVYITFMNSIYQQMQVNIMNVQELGILEVNIITQYFLMFYSLFTGRPLANINKNLMTSSIPQLTLDQLALLILSFIIYFSVSTIYNRLSSEEIVIENYFKLAYSNYGFSNILKNLSILLLLSGIFSFLLIYYVAFTFGSSYNLVLSTIVIPVLLAIVILILTAK